MNVRVIGAGLESPGCAWVCSNCGAVPRFGRRVSWGFNMADAYCPNADCDRGGVFCSPVAFQLQVERAVGAALFGGAN